MASRGKRKNREPGAVRRGAAAAGSVLGGIVKAAAVPVLAAAVYAAGVWCLWQYAAREAVRPADPQVDAESCPWLSPRDVAEINGAVHFGSRASMYDRDICRRVAARYARNPWVEEVVAVRRQFPNRVVVDLAIRQPFARVRREGTYYLVDRRGFRLPIKPTARPGSDPPAIAGVLSPPPQAGEVWGGRPLRDSLRLVGTLGELLEGRGAGLRLASVQVADAGGSFDNLPQLVARTASGMVIDWGSYNESETYLYPSVEEKCRELEKVLDGVADPAVIESVMVRYQGHSLRLRPGSTTAATGATGAVE